jgi:hypothetical protein
MNRKLCVLAGLLALVGACGEDEKEPAVGQAEFCSRWAAAACSQGTVDACQAASVEACRTAQQEGCMDQLGDDFVDSGSDTCINAIELAYMDADLTADELRLIELGGDCRTVVSGPGDEGDDCSEDRDCDRSASLECVIRDGSGVGSCQVPNQVGAGRSCDDPGDVCETDFFCSSTDYCLERFGDDEECSYSGQCNSDAFCNLDRSVADGGSPDGGSPSGGSTAGVCEARHPTNDPCTENEQCQSGICYEFSSTERVCINRLRLSRSEPICATLR